MEYLILSDIHLRKGFEKKKMNFLIELIKKYNNIIINGDLYEARYIKPDSLLNGKYKPLLNLLREKDTIYIYGNHDPKDKSDLVAKYISKKQYEYLKIKLGNRCYHIEHGHNLGFGSDNTSDFVFRIIDNISYQIQKYFDFLTHYLGSNWNKIIIKNRRSTRLINETETLVVGHTHVKCIDLNNKFINGGYIKYGRGSYVVISDSKTELITVKY